MKGKFVMICSCCQYVWLSHDFILTDFSIFASILFLTSKTKVHEKFFSNKFVDSLHICLQ